MAWIFGILTYYGGCKSNVKSGLNHREDQKSWYSLIFLLLGLGSSPLIIWKELGGFFHWHIRWVGLIEEEFSENFLDIRGLVKLNCFSFSVLIYFQTQVETDGTHIYHLKCRGQFDLYFSMKPHLLSAIILMSFTNVLKIGSLIPSGVVIKWLT